MLVPTEKVSLTLDARALAEVRRRVGKRGVSAYVDDAVRAKLQRERLTRWLDEMDAEYGPPSDKVRREAEREWARGSAALRRVKRKR
jgi:Arc/MetJ family transcription regulator